MWKRAILIYVVSTPILGFVLKYILHFPLRFAEDAFMGWLQVCLSEWGIMAPISHWLADSLVYWILPFLLAFIIVCLIYWYAQRGQNRLSLLDKRKEIYSETLPKYLAIWFPDRVVDEQKGKVSLLAKQLCEGGYMRVGQVDKAINKARNAFLLYQQKYTGSTGEAIYQTGAVWISLQILDYDFYKLRGGKSREEWEEVYRDEHALIQQPFLKEILLSIGNGMTSIGNKLTSIAKRM